MLGKLFNIENLYIGLYDSDKNMISFPFYSIEGKKIQTSSRVFGNGLTEFVIKTKKSLMINSAKHEIIDSLGITPHGKEALSVISTPMIAGEKVIGVITLQDYKRENVFSQSQLDTLSTISSQAAIAIENAELYSSLKRSLLEKEILLKEVHHRVKNNLQIMSSLIKLQSHYVSDKQMLQILNETESRIQSMAIVHSKLYSTQEYEKVNFGEYVKNLTDNFWNTYGIKLKNLNFDIQVENISINIDTAIPCGLIINELVSNSIKYAFPDNRKGTITIILMKESSSRFYKLIVKDDGIGLKKAVKIEKADTLGIQLVNLLTKQMNGTFEIKSEKNKGCQIIITLEESIYRARN
jgi:two-component sensor histidine kinase